MAAGLKLHQVNYNLAACCCQHRKGKRLGGPLKPLSGLEFSLGAQEYVPKYNLQESDSPSQNTDNI